MPSILAGNLINVRPGEPAFAVSTNLCDWFELGDRAGTDYWLEGNIVGSGEFVFNGRLYLPSAGVAGTINDLTGQFPEPDTASPDGCRMSVEMELIG